MKDQVLNFMLSGLVISHTSPQGNLLPFLSLSQVFSLLLLLPEVKEEPQLFLAIQKPLSKLFIYRKKTLKAYQRRECNNISFHLPQTEEYHRKAEKA